MVQTVPSDCFLCASPSLLWGLQRVDNSIGSFFWAGEVSRVEGSPLAQGRLCLRLQLGNTVTKAGEGRVLMEAMASLGRQAPERPSHLHTRGHLQLSKEMVLSYKLHWEQKPLLSTC